MHRREQEDESELLYWALFAWRAILWRRYFRTDDCAKRAANAVFRHSDCVRGMTEAWPNE